MHLSQHEALDQNPRAITQRLIASFPQRENERLIVEA